MTKMLRVLIAMIVAYPAAKAVALVVPRSAVITTDCGTDIDDQWAIVQLAISSDIKTLGVIGNFAPNALNTSACAKSTLDAIGMPNQIPVLKGAIGPISDLTKPQRNEGVSFLIEISKRFSRDNRLVVLGMGTGTDVASAILIDPTIVDRIEFHALAFNSYPEGVDGWNVTNDVKAYQVILNADVPVTLASGQIANDQLTLLKSESRAMVGAVGAAGAYLADLHVNYIDNNAQYFPEMEGQHWPIWDAAVVSTALGFAKAELRARPSINDDQTFSFPNKRSQAQFRWVTDLDRDRVFQDLVNSLQKIKTSIR